MSSVSAVIPKLVGSENYAIWALRMKAIFVERGVKAVITSDDVSEDANDRALGAIHMFVDDGPLVQIQNEERAHKAWTMLKSLYSSSGFSSEFITIKEFFRCKLEKFDSMELFINKIKQLNDELASKDLALPKQVVMSWVLDNLTSQYEFIVTGITQSLRVNPKSYDLEMLFSSLVDESKRLSSTDNKTDQVLMASSRGSFKDKAVWPKNHLNNNRVKKNKYCRHCRNNNHPTSECWDLFPEKRPKNFRNRNDHRFSVRKPIPSYVAPVGDQSSKEALIQEESDVNLVNMDFEVDPYCEQVYTLSHICCSDMYANSTNVKDTRTFLMKQDCSSAGNPMLD